LFDKELVKEILTQILAATQTILLRFEPINSSSDFTDTPSGMEKLDAICMQLIAIGESLKKVDKMTENKMLCKYPEIDWKGAKGLRDVISHQYFDVDAEAIYTVCKNKIQPLAQIIRKMLQDLD
jgi:uncharacterized protein with HEPN domain